MSERRAGGYPSSDEIRSRYDISSQFDIVGEILDGLFSASLENSSESSTVLRYINTMGFRLEYIKKGGLTSTYWRG